MHVPDHNRIPSDGKLMDTILTGDPKAKEEAKKQLYIRHNPGVRKFLVGFLNKKNCNSPHQHLEDASSKTWLNAYSKLHQVKEPDRLNGWLIAIAKNEVYKHLRNDCIPAERSVEIEDRPLPDACEERYRPEAQIYNYYESLDAAVDADKALKLAADVSSELEKIIYRRMFKDQGFDKIAADLGMSLVNVRNLYYRGLKELRKKL
jgi:RNA polymerase sigma factor (sigma-70 family)